MRIVVTGSLAWDYIMNFPGRFGDHILPDKVHMLTVSFLVDSMKRLRGGTAGNIVYNLALLGENPLLVSAAGADFQDYRAQLEKIGVDTRGVLEIPGEFTASCFINTDQANNQIVAFYPGAAGHGKEVSLEALGLAKQDWVIISPTDPTAMKRHTQECKRLGAHYIFDPGKQTPRLEKAQILTGLDGCAVLIGNDYEFGMMAKACGISEEALSASAPLTVITQGEKGSLIIDRVSGKRHQIPIAPVGDVVDPTGAGDAYISGLAWGLKRGLPHEVSGRVAALTSAFAIEKKGCQEHTFSKDLFGRRYQEVFGSPLPI